MSNQVSKIKFAVIAITYRCNSRCQMCNIWQLKPGPELTMADFKKLPKTLKEVNLTGGEPFLRTDIVEIVDLFMSYPSVEKLTISSNGFLNALIIPTVKKMLDKGYGDRLIISISIDGMGDKHAQVRGIPNAFATAVKTIRDLKEIGLKNIGISYTFMAGNETEFEQVRKLADELGVGFGPTIAHNADNYFGTDTNDQTNAEMVTTQIDRQIEEEIGSFSLKTLGKLYYNYGISYYAHKHRAMLPCQALDTSFFVDPKGNVYPCNILSQSIGNIHKQSFAKIWSSKEAGELRKEIKSCRKCWMFCTAKPSIVEHKLEVGQWVLKRKVLHMIRRLGLVIRSTHYYFFGLSVMLLSKIRGSLLSYQNPRPIKPKNIGKSIDYDLATIKKFEDNLAKIDNKLTVKNKRVVELGPGYDLGNGLIFLSKQAKSYQALDYFHNLRMPVVFYDELFKKIKSQLNKKDKNLAMLATTVTKVKKAILSKKYFALPGLEFTRYKASQIAEAINGKVDVIFSQAVLEHISVKEQAKLFKGMHQSLAPRGYIYHEIDFQDHTRFFRKSDPLNLLRFNEFIYRLLGNAWTPNRLRASDYVRLATEAGFKDVQLIPLERIDWQSLSAKTHCLSQKFKKYSNNELAVLSAVLFARK